MEANNMKAMREALKVIRGIVNEELEDLKDISDEVRADFSSIRGWCDHALAAPPRNCERFETAEDAKKEFNYLWNFVWKRGGGCVDEREYRSEYDKWLFSPIQEGDTNGSR